MVVKGKKAKMLWVRKEVEKKEKVAREEKANLIVYQSVKYFSFFLYFINHYD